MSELAVILSYLRARACITGLTVLSVALGLTLATLVLILTHQTQRALNTETARWDLVVSAKGSPLQIVLNSLYYLDAPTGNIPVALWQRLAADPVVARVLPLTMGDNYTGAPIVGTVPAFFDGRQARGGRPLYARGRCFAAPFEAVVGADVAARHRLQLGQRMVGAHGWGRTDDFHPQFPYTVVGILAPTGSNLDRAVYTDYHSTWIVHAHPDADEHPAPGHDPTQEVTALLVRLHQPGARFHLQQDINAHHAAQAAVPVDEIDKVARTFIAPLQGVLLLVAYLVVLVSALSILISLYHAIHQRRRDIAVMRALGASRGDVFRLVTLEAAVLAGLGVLVGGLLGHGLAALGAPLVLARFGIALAPWQVMPVEVVIAGSVWVLGLLAGIWPAAIAYRLPVAETIIQE